MFRRLLIAIIISAALGMGTWSMLRSHWYASQANRVMVYEDDGAGPDDGSLEALNVQHQLSSHQIEVSKLIEDKSKRMGLIIGCVSLPFLILLMMPGRGKKKRS